MVTGGSSISLTYIASERIIPGYIYMHYLLHNLYIQTCHVKMMDA